MKHSLKTGLCFGMTSGVITTLGLMVGLHSGTHSKLVVIGGILIIAIADAFSDALGIHISEEAKNNKHKDIWEATVVTLLVKFFFALTFVVPVILLNLSLAIKVSIVWGLMILAILSYYIARDRGSSPVKVIGEHLTITIIVIVITHKVGDWIALKFS
jgi:VIT1/CCC1 family predicted Fe2+/Mn2+ transporter